MSTISYLTFICSTLFTYIFGIISKKHKWNNTLPIPIQNCIVGVGVFILAYVFCLVMKIETNPNDMIQQIICALGGAGTATLGYDTQKINKE